MAARAHQRTVMRRLAKEARDAIQQLAVAVDGEQDASSASSDAAGSGVDDVARIGSEERPVDVEENECGICDRQLRHPILACTGSQCKQEFHQNCVAGIWEAQHGYPGRECPLCRHDCIRLVPLKFL